MDKSSEGLLYRVADAIGDQELHNSHPPVATLLTAPLPAGIATIGVRGPRSESVVLSCVRLSTSRLIIGRIYYGRWFLDHSNIESFEQVVVCQTQAGQVELHCHGGSAICQSILDGLKDAGCELVDARHWGENCGAIEAAAREDLLNATTDRAAAILLDQHNGALARQLKALQNVVELGDCAAALGMIETLLSWSSLGTHLAKPWRIVLAGPPNVGKSSLINAIVGAEKSIVHPQPGTTRDWIEAETAIDGWPISITDTAGVRASEDLIEKHGIRLAKEQLNESDLAVIVVDAHVGWTRTHTQLLELSSGNCIVAFNKADLNGDYRRSKIPSQLRWVAVSCVTSPGIEGLLRSISTSLVPEIPPPECAVLFRLEQVEQLKSLSDCLARGEPEVAAAQLKVLLRSWISGQDRS